MRKFIIISVFLFLVFSYQFYLGEQSKVQSIEEEVISRSFALYQAALVYDDICNGQSSEERYDLEKQENIIRLGNEQILAARFGGVLHLRDPDKNPDEIVAHMIAFSKNVKAITTEKLEHHGCDSDAGQAGEKVWKFYTTTPPWHTSAMMDDEIEKNGGTVTSVKDIEASAKKHGKKHDQMNAK